MASVTMRQVEKVYDKTKVVHGVDLDVADEEFVVLVGPSGCGKSTLLRMVAGLEVITGGEILIGGDKVNDMAPKDRDVAMVFQNYALYPHKTVRQNMAFSLRLRGTAKDKIGAQVERAAEILGLTDYLDRYPRQLSGGQRQRVAMGRAIVRDPRVFLFDEPLSNLDAKLRAQMRTEIKELHQELRTTSIYVTHDQDEAMTMADRIVVLKDGRVEQIGRPLDLYDHPANTFVAGFIGSPAMNFLEGTMDDGGAAEMVTTDGTRWPTAGAQGGGAGAPITYGVRPEHIDFGEGGVPAKVDLVEPRGAVTEVIVHVGTQQISVLTADRVSLTRGEAVSLVPRADAIHLFDKTSGDRLAA
ncbi:MAG: sn-glycerol-3-phosphate ABC transporter ATP-binding protein UgpC [Devosia sp.]